MKFKSQPRIKGIKRIPKGASFHPMVDRVIRQIMKEDGKSYSYVVAEFASIGCGVDFFTGKLIKYGKKEKV